MTVVAEISVFFLKLKQQSNFTLRFWTSELGSISVSLSMTRKPKSVCMRGLDIRKSWVLLRLIGNPFEYPYSP